MGRKKKEALTQFNRNNILETAKKLFHENGLNNTTMDDIAKHADYSKSTIYVYFKSKDEIYHYIIYDNMVQLHELMKKNFDLVSHTFDECFLHFCNDLVSFQKEYPLFTETVFHQVKDDSGDHEEMAIIKDITRLELKINRIITNYIKKGLELKQIHVTMDEMQVTETLWASICGVISLANSKQSFIQKEMNADQHEFLQGSFALLLRSLKN